MGKVTLKVVPSSSRDQIVGWLGQALKIKVQAPPEKGKANAAVLALLGKSLNLSGDQLQIVSGETSPTKTLEVTGLTDEELRQRLADLTA